MTAVKLREWRGVKPVPGPSGAAIRTRLRTTPEDNTVLNAVAGHLGRLRRADLAHVCRPVPPGLSLDDEAKRQARRDALNVRKQTITAESSSRWAGTIIRANDDQYRLARESQARHIVSLGAAISSIEKRLAQPTGDSLAHEYRKTRKGPTRTKGYTTQAERFQKQRRLQSLRAELSRAMADRDHMLARVVDGGKRLAKTRHNLSTVGLAEAEWRERWSRARWRIEANGSGQASRHGIRLLAVNPAYTSAWGDQHWRKPYENVTRHEAAATVIGRRAQGHKAQRREGVTRTRPEDRVVRATNQAGPGQSRATSSRHRPRMRGIESRPPGRTGTRLSGRATVTPALASSGHLHS